MQSVNDDRAAGYYDATRALPAEVMRALTDLLAAAVARDLRDWAAQAGLPPHTTHRAESAVRCWAFELPGGAAGRAG